MGRWSEQAVIDRFFGYVDKTPTCWLWKGATTEGRYGQFFVSTERGSMRAHRFTYEHFIGPVPEGLQIDHLCNNGLCVNPAHLEPVTAKENQRRASERRPTCRNGHPHPGIGMRCKPCGAERARRYRLSKEKKR